jgi:hypothetical protein
MLYYENGEWQLMPYVAKYKQYNQEFEEHVTDKTDKQTHLQAGNITDLTFENAEYEQDVLNRLEEVKDYPEEDFQAVHDYVFENKVREGSPLDLKKKNESLELTVLELSMMLGGGL